MGTDKAMLPLAGAPLAVHVAQALSEVAYPVLAVGNEAGTGLRAVDDPREGPLVAVVAGARALGPITSPVLVVACDLPFVRPELLRLLLDELGPAAAVVPMLDGMEQPLCACYAPRALDVAASLVAQGVRAMHRWIAALDVVRLEEDEWSAVAPEWTLGDVDTPEDYQAAVRLLEGPTG